MQYLLGNPLVIIDAGMGQENRISYKKHRKFAEWIQNDKLLETTSEKRVSISECQSPELGQKI